MKSTRNNILFKLLTIILITVHFIDFSIYSSVRIYQLKFIIPIIIILEWLIRKKFKVTFRLHSIFFAVSFYMLIIAIIASMLNTDIVSEAAIQGLSYLILFIMSFLVVPDYISTKEDYIKYLKIYLMVFFLLMLANIILGQLNPAHIYTNFNNRLRYRGVFVNPNSLGLFSIVGVILSFSLFVLLEKKYYLLSCVFFFFVIVYSDSNTALIASIVFMANVLLMIGLKKGKPLVRLLCGLFTLGFFAFSVIGAIWMTFNFNIYTLAQLDQILNSRVNRSLTALTGFNTVDFIIGKGLGSRIENPHNAFINTLVELGIFGVISIYCMKAIVFINALKALKNRKDLFIQKTMIISTSMIVTFIIYGFSESLSITLGNIVSIFMWSSFGIHMTLIRSYK